MRNETVVSLGHKFTDRYKKFVGELVKKAALNKTDIKLPTIFDILTTGLASMAFTLCLNTPPDQLDMLILDMGAGTLAPLKDLPHVSAYVIFTKEANYLQRSKVTELKKIGRAHV